MMLHLARVKTLYMYRKYDITSNWFAICNYILNNGYTVSNVYVFTTGINKSPSPGSFTTIK